MNVEEINRTLGTVCAEKVRAALRTHANGPDAGRTQAIAWTDGACSGNPGPGGWAVLVLGPGGAMSAASGQAARSTSSSMELTAALGALHHSDPDVPLVVASDSRYVIDGMTKWAEAWIANSWRRPRGGAVKNREHWERLIAAAEGRDITWRHVAGHAGVAGNEAADALARAACNGRVIPPPANEPTGPTGQRSGLAPIDALMTARELGEYAAARPPEMRLRVRIENAGDG